MSDQNDQDRDNNELLAAWHAWEGRIDCARTRQIWDAPALRGVADDITRKLMELPTGSGSSVGIALHNTAAFPAALAATLQAGHHPVLIPATATQAEVVDWVHRCGLSHVITAWVPATSQRSPFAEMGDLSLELTPGTNLPDRAYRAGSPAILHSTSGTYGKASFCIRNQRVAVAEAQNFLETIDCYDRSNVVITTPLSHAYAYGFGLVTSLLTHSTLVLDEAFNPRRLLARHRQRPGDVMAIVPPMARVLAKLGAAGPESIAPHVFFAGAACPMETRRMFSQRFGVNLHAIYGTTETGAIATSYGTGADTSSVGRVLPGVEVHIEFTSRYSNLGSGVGEVFVRSKSMMQGYVSTPTRWGDQGSFGTGDLGRIDEAGHLHLVGRLKDMINLGGMKVDPAPVEQALRTHPAVADAAVYPGIDPNGREFVQATIEPAQGHLPNEPALRAHCAGLIDTFRIPTVFHFVTALPRTASGKCIKIACPGYPPGLGS